MRNKAFLIFAASLCVIIASLTLDNPEHVLAFKPVGPVESVPDGSSNATAEPSLVTDTSSFLDYENSTFGMRIEYPSNWTSYESQNGSSELIVQFTDRPSNENNNFTMMASRRGLAIKGAPFTANSSTTDLSLWTQQQLNLLMTSLPSFKLDEIKSLSLNSDQQNIPATMTTYTYMDPTGHEVNAFIVDIFKDGRAYSLEYSAEPEVYHKHFPVLLKMINSFEIDESPQTTMFIPASTRFSQYENGTMGIKIEYPDNWMYKEEGEGVTFGFPGGFFYVAKTPGVNSTLEEESANHVNYLRQSFSGFDLNQAEPTMLPGVNFTSSNLVIYTGSTEIGELYKYMDIITVYNGDLYWIEYAADLKAYEIFEPTIQRMIDSFQIMRVPASERSTSSPAPTSTPSFSSKFGLDRIENVNLENGTTYPIKYKITAGQITGMSLTRTSDGRPSLIIDIIPEDTEADANGNGRLQLETPNVVLDPNRKLVVFDDLGPTEWKELARDPRAVVLEAAFYASTEQNTIEIVGLG